MWSKAGALGGVMERCMEVRAAAVDRYGDYHGVDHGDGLFVAAEECAGVLEEMGDLERWSACSVEGFGDGGGAGVVGHRVCLR